MATKSVLSALASPERLIAETRVDFRCAALDRLERVAEQGTTELVVDMAGTRDVDAAGLGILVLVQKRAREIGVAIKLSHTQPQVRTLLQLTKLDGLFLLEAPVA